MKKSPRPLFNLHQTWQLAICIRAGSILLASAKPKFIRRTARSWSMIHYSRERFSTAPMGASVTPLQPTYVAARPWKPISWSSWQVPKLLPETVWNSVVRIATEDRPFLRATCFSTWQSRSLSLLGLPLCSWAVVAPRHFHFTIAALTVDLCSSSRAEIWQTDLL